MLDRLKKCSYGCHIGHVFLGALSYADDIVLLCPTLKAVNSMLTICDKFSDEYNILFNASKSKLVVHNCKVPDDKLSPVTFRGNRIPVVKTIKHIGITVGSSDNVDEIRITDTCNELYGKLNLLLRQVNAAKSDLKYKLFKTYCSSFYGSALWRYANKNCINRLETAWRNCVRRIFNLPYNCHRYLFKYITKDDDVIIKLHTRYIKFMLSLSNSNNVCIRMCLNALLCGSRSCTSQSYNHICYRYGIPKGKFDSSILKHVNSPINDREANVGTMIADFVEYRDDNNHDANVQCIIDYLCTL